SVDRATLMAAAYFGGRALDQRGPPLNALAFVAGCLVAASPLAIADPAFVLTFGATLGILVVMPLVARHRLPRLVAPVGAMLAASVAAEAMLFPVSALVFSRVTFAGLALNFLAIPLMAVAQIAGMATIPIAVVSPAVAAAAGYIAHLGAAGLVRSAELVRFAPALTWRVAPPDWKVVAGSHAAPARARGRGGAARPRACRARREGRAGGGGRGGEGGGGGGFGGSASRGRSSCRAATAGCT